MAKKEWTQEELARIFPEAKPALKNPGEAISFRLNFLNDHVIKDAFFNSKSGFAIRYEKLFGLSKLESYIIWDGIRENIDSFNPDIKETHLLPEAERLQLLSYFEAEEAKKEDEHREVRIQEIIKPHKTKKAKIIAMSQEGFDKAFIGEYLVVDPGYLDDVYVENSLK